MKIQLQPADFVLVNSRSIMGRGISLAEKRNALGDSQYIHAFNIEDTEGGTIDTLLELRRGNINEYAGCPVLIGRYSDANNAWPTQALRQIARDIGQVYPVYRLVLDFFGIGRFFRTKRIVCSERVAKFLYFLTGMKAFQNWYGWEPSDLADVAKHWREFEVVYEGVWEA